MNNTNLETKIKNVVVDIEFVLSYMREGENGWRTKYNASTILKTTEEYCANDIISWGKRMVDKFIQELEEDESNHYIELEYDYIKYNQCYTL